MVQSWSLVVSLLCLVGAVSAHTFTTIDVPFTGATATVVTGVNAAGTLVGIYTDQRTQTHGFLRDPGGTYYPLFGVTPQHITDLQVIAGTMPRCEGSTQGFILASGTLYPVQLPVHPMQPEAPPISQTEVRAINEAGLVVGSFLQSGIYHGFTYDRNTAAFHVHDGPPGALLSFLVGVNTSGTLLGLARDSSNQAVAFLVEQGTVTVLNIALPSEIRVEGIADNGLVVGNHENHGFTYLDGAVDVITYPGATLTEITGVSNAGVLHGRYVDTSGVSHGFLAVPDMPPPLPAPTPPGRAPRERPEPRKR